MPHSELAPGLYRLTGAVNTGVLVSSGKALLFDCCDTVTPARLAELGVQAVDLILCTQHRRPNTAGAYAFVEAGAELVVPAAERPLFEAVDAYWSDWKNRWHIYHHQPGAQVLARALPVARGVREGDVIEWEGHAVQVLDTPGATDGSVSYLLDVAGRKVCFSGDVLYGPGQIWDVYSLQKGHDVIGDYHGFMGNRGKLLPSLHTLASCGADVLVPSHGEPIRDALSATEAVEKKLDALWRNYTALSALNHYFPTLFDDTKDDPLRMKPARTSEPPAWVRRVAFTSFAVVSETGAALLIDCGHDSVVGTLQEWINEKRIASVEGCWVTHYHDDHVDALHRFAQTFNCPILCDRHVAEIVEHPQRFFLPCIAPCPAPVAKATEDGETWRWHEFQLTACHFPGQTLYHGGLLVEGHGTSVFFAGDSGAPAGLDDYCCGNRVFLGAGRGFRRCIEIWRERRPEYIVNQHQDRAFSFTSEELDYMDRLLMERERLVSELTPWDDPNFALDEWWVRTYPFEQEVAPGARCAVDVRFTNHAPREVEAMVEPALPADWTTDEDAGTVCIRVAAKNDGAARVRLNVPHDAAPGRYIVPFWITWGERHLGPFRHGVVTVR